MKVKIKYPLLLVLTIVICLVVFATTALALTWNGSSSADGGGGTASNGYSVDTDGTSLVGFRFSLVDSSSNQLGNSVDVFTGAKMDTTSELSTAKKLTLKKSKAYWVSYYSSVSSLTTSTDNTNCYVQSSMGFATNLPVISSADDINNNVLADNLDAWQKKYTNINAILDKVGDAEVTDYSDITTHKIIIEPIFLCRLANSERHVLTMTEMAVYGGGYVFGDWDSDGGSSANDGSWGYISAYTNRYFPEYMTTDGAECNWGAPTALSSRATFRNIITKGYGASVLTAETMGTSNYKLTVNYYSNGATSSFSGALNTVGAGKNVLVRTYDFYSSTAYPGGLHDYVGISSATHLSRTGYTATGKWGTTTSGGTLVDELTSFSSGADLAKAFGLDLSTGNKTLNLYAQWDVNKLTVNYYSNGATYAKYNESGTAVSADNNVLVRTYDFIYDTSYPTGLHDYGYASAATYLAKTGYNGLGEGSWGTTTSGGIVIGQEVGFSSGAALAEALGLDISSGNATVNLYALWEPNRLTVNSSLETNINSLYGYSVLLF